MDIELLTFTLAAGASVRFERAGRYFEVIDAPYGIASIALQDASGSQVGFVRNCLSGVFAELAFKAIDIVNGSTAQTIQLLVTDGRGGSRRQPGLVRIVDQGAEKTLAGLQFWGSISTIATAGVASLVFFKPGAPKLYIKALTVQSSVAGDIVVGVGSGDGTVITGGGSLAMRNKSLNGAGSSGLMGSGQSAAATPTVGEAPGWFELARVNAAANSPVTLPLTTPLYLEGNDRLYVTGAALNRNISALFDAEETV